MRMATVMEMASSTCPMAVETATEIRRSAMKGFQNCRKKQAGLPDYMQRLYKIGQTCSRYFFHSGSGPFPLISLRPCSLRLLLQGSQII